MDRKRPWDEPIVGAIVPLAQRHLPPHEDFDAARPEGLLFLRGRARAGRPGIWFDPEVVFDPRWQKRWSSTEKVELRLTPTRIVLLRRGAPGTRPRPVSERLGTPPASGLRLGSRHSESPLQESSQYVCAYNQQNTEAMRTSENCVKAKFAEILFHALR